MNKSLWIKGNFSRLLILIVLASFFIFQACKKDSENPETFYRYLNSFEKVSSLSQTFITTIYRFQSVQYPEISELMENTDYNVDVYRITYKTTYRDSDIIASGIVCIPDAPEAFPIISFQNGTNSAHENAPSVAVSNSYFTLLQSLSGNGYIVLIPDYIGFGSSEEIVHPYYHTETNNKAVVDMMYATKELFEYYEGSAIYNETCFLMGYSQGGWATLSLLKEIESNPNIDFSVMATSCGAGAYDLIQIADEILQKDTFSGPIYLPYYIYSHQQYGSIHDPLQKFFQEPYSSDIPTLFNGEYTNSEVNEMLTPVIADLMTSELVNNYLLLESYHELRIDLTLNSVEAWNVHSLLHFYHGNADNTIPYNQSQTIYNDFLSLGIDAERIRLIEMDGMDHNEGILPWGISSIIWFNQLKSEQESF